MTVVGLIVINCQYNSRHVPVSVEKTLKLLSQKPAAMRKRESTVVTKQLLRARTRWEKLSPSWRRDRACAPPAAVNKGVLVIYHAMMLCLTSFLLFVCTFLQRWLG